MERSSRIERNRQLLHPRHPIVYHLEKVPWTLFGSLTFRVVPPDHVQKQCIFEFIRRVTKKFNTNPDFNWGTRWIFRKEYGEKNGRCHWHFLIVLDKPQPNMVAFTKQIEHIWQVLVASRQVGRYNEEKEKHNAKLRKELRFKNSKERDEEYAKRCRPHIRNDFSSPGYADVRQFDPKLAGVDYIMKGDNWTYSGANAYELAKFNDRDNTETIASHKLLMSLYLKQNGKTTRRDKLIFQQRLLDQHIPSCTGSQDAIRKTRNTSSQLWDSSPDFVVATESWTSSQY